MSTNLKTVKNGLFITLEGGEGSGKTTCAKLLVANLIAQGYDAVYVREPGGNKAAESIRNIVLNNDFKPETELLLFSASRSIIVDQINKYLSDGRIVICDRYIASTYVYQGIVGGVSYKYLDPIIFLSTKGLTPTVEFLLDIPAEIGLERVSKNNRETNVLDNRGLEYHKKVNKAYHNVMACGRKVIIDATDEVDNIIPIMFSNVILEIQRREE